MPHQKPGNIQQNSQQLQMNSGGNQNPQSNSMASGNQILSTNLQNQQIVIINQQQGQQSNVNSQHRFQILQNQQSQQNAIQKSNQGGVINTPNIPQIQQQQQKIMKMQGNQMVSNQSSTNQHSQQVIHIPVDGSNDSHQKILIQNQQSNQQAQQQAVQQIVQQLQNQTENINQTPIVQAEQLMQVMNQNQLIPQQPFNSNSTQNINVQRGKQFLFSINSLVFPYNGISSIYKKNYNRPVQSYS